MTAGQNGKAHHTLLTTRNPGLGRPVAIPLTGGMSGRVFVAVAVVTIMLVWGSIYLVFRDWRVRYRVRAEFGATQVASAIDPLALVKPNDIDAGVWRDSVDQTHKMLITLTASNLLDRPQMEALRGEIKNLVANATPNSAKSRLLDFWNAQKNDAGPVLNRHPIPPPLIPPRSSNQ